MTDGVDPSGNPILGDIGPWFAKQIKKKLGADTKYIDPTYMVRGVVANAHDKVYCATLGQNAAHAAMAGFTGCTVGLARRPAAPGRGRAPRLAFFWRGGRELLRRQSAECGAAAGAAGEHALRVPAHPDAHREASLRGPQQPHVPASGGLHRAA